MKSLKKVSTNASKQTGILNKRTTGKPDAKQNVKRVNLTSKILVKKIQEKVNASLTIAKRESLLNRFKYLKKKNTDRAIKEKLSILGRITGKKENQLKAPQIAEEVESSVAQIYNLARVNRLLNERPVIKKYMKEYGIKVSEIMALSRKQTASGLVNILKKYVENGVLEPITPFTSKATLSLAKKSAFSAKESKLLYDELSSIINKHKKGKVSQLSKQSIASFVEQHIAS